MKRNVKISIDLMGGENSPKKNLEGVNLFIKRYLKEKDYFFYLHGDENKINKIISNYKYLNSNYKLLILKLSFRMTFLLYQQLKKVKIQVCGNVLILKLI